MSSTVVAGSEMAVGVRFDPDRLAYLEIAGLRAYYDHQWFRAFQLIIELMHEQFGLSWLRSVQAPYYVVRAMLAWAPKDADKRTTHRYIRKFYRLAATYGRGATFDPVQAGNREYVYWDLHRKRGIDPNSDVEPYVECLASLHTVIFGVGLDEARKSAVLRAQATDFIDSITGKRSLDVDGDWRKAEARLREAYRTVAA
ncbi:MAG: hypothetical protein ABI670_19780 [Chloroflexota bacterium]